MNGWTSSPLGKIASLKYGKSLPAGIRVPGNVPVYGSNGIVGWHDKAIVNSAGIIIGRKGTVGAVHFSAVPFCPIDTTYFIGQDDSSADLRFLAYLLQHAKLSRLVSDLVPGLNRDSALARIVAMPEDRAEQRQIAAVISMVQKAIERQEHLIALTGELKSALMKKLFTEGTMCKPLRETKLGMIPENWVLKTCDDLCSKISVGVVVKPRSYYVDAGVPAFRSFNVRADRLTTDDLVYFSHADNSGVLSKSSLRSGDVLIVRTGYPGTSCVVPKEFDGANCIDIIFARPNPLVESTYLSRFLNSEAGKTQATASSHGLAQQHLNVGAVKRVLVPLPPLEEQREIVDCLAAVDRKADTHSQLAKALTDLFRTILHDLMSAKVRVHELDLSALRSRGVVEAV